MSETTSLPQLRIGAEVRPNIEPYTDRRGIVINQAGRVYGVRLDGEGGAVDFAESELTVIG